MAKLSDFDYALPESSIASEPSLNRTGSKLLKTSKNGEMISHHVFSDLPQFFQPGDVLVLNNTKVIPARLIGKRKSGGQTEALLVKAAENGMWEALMRPSGRLKKDEVLEFGDNGVRVSAQIVDGPRPHSAKRLLAFQGDLLAEKLEAIGHMPLPPYIRRPDHAGDRTRYQTVFASQPGAIAAPTAGLHFDQALLETLKKKGVEIVYVTLHVSYGTFQPLQEENFEKHKIHEEDYEVSADSAGVVNRALREKRRIIACGTTAVRALESAAGANGEVQAFRGTTELFIYPPFKFRIVHGLITNFHLPKSSLLLLTAAFLDSREKLFRIYKEAMDHHYRFYSYGDAMLIL